MQLKNEFDIDTVKKILRGAFIAGGGVFAVYILQAISTLNFGDYTAVVAALCSVLINAIREWNKGE